MKKAVLLLAMTLVSSFAFGQIQKGDIQLGGNLRYSKTDGPGFEASVFQLTPRAALFLNDNTSIGLSLGYSSTTTNQGAGDNSTDTFTFGAFARFHKNVADRFYLFLQPDISFGIGTQENPNFASDFDVSTFNFNIVPGVLYFISDKIAMEMNMGGIFYGTNKTEGNGLDQSVDNYGLNFNLTNITIGASIYLR
ncbi:outer membrane beta-barrel protein [Roseivirga sp. E12]|uniref:outer membrane beta-barrel protein n=1 Tax=Roseivirga sp. E12 TaxID=2819237 RepID=UPI001ABC25E4|nr:outer membrane beta-barrel protein [Roseivirga sp. E12]MBO3698202.1 porin family protein [Roseivirga sp. E12]